MMWKANSWTSGRVLMLLGRIALGGVFIYAAYTKLSQSWVLFAMAIQAYRLLPEWSVTLLARLLPWLELGLGAALLFGWMLRTVAAAAAALLLGFFSIMAYSYATHPEGSGINCGCFGFGEAISVETLVRDGLLVLIALAVTYGAFRTRRAEVEDSELPPGTEPQQAA